jgi:hypothetical protein
LQIAIKNRVTPFHIPRQVFLYAFGVERVEVAKVCGALALLGVLVGHEWAATRAAAAAVADAEPVSQVKSSTG